MSKKTIIIIGIIIVAAAYMYEKMHEGMPDGPFDVLLKLVLGISGFAYGYILTHALRNKDK